MSASKSTTSRGLPAPRQSAKALLLTVLGEFVLPSGGSAWTSSLVRAGSALGIGEKNARQAIARIAEQGLLASQRHGRKVRWSLTDAGSHLLKTGTDRIYIFGAGADDWAGTWLLAHCPIAESQRSIRDRLRTQLAFLGFGELSPSLVISPHVEREADLRAMLHDLDVLDASVVLRSTTSSPAEDHDLVKRAWDLDELGATYDKFRDAYAELESGESWATFRTVVELVHDWRRFPLIDPELPKQLLPDPWAGTEATALFHQRHREWSPTAQTWWTETESHAS